MLRFLGLVMQFEKLAHVDISDGSCLRRISVYHGDLAAIPVEHAVDLLVVSAFPNDYIPTPRSLIGALHRAGISVRQLATAKEHDLRSTCSFWLSKPLSATQSASNVTRIACFESGFIGPPTAVVGDLFRGLFPFVNGAEDSVVAMPLLAAGDQRYPPETMFDAILDAASHWLSKGLGITELKIVVYDRQLAESLAVRLQHTKPPVPAFPQDHHFDVFLSFSSSDREAADIAKAALEMRKDIGAIFDYRFSIDKGVSWQTKIDEAISSCRSIVAIISPKYMASPECQEELLQARLRHKREGGSVLFPVYWRKWEGDIALWLQLINAVDCREADTQKLDASVAALRFAG